MLGFDTELQCRILAQRQTDSATSSSVYAHIKKHTLLSLSLSERPWDSPFCVGWELNIKIMFDWLWWPMWWPPLITVLVDNNRARLQGMEVERGGEERAEINYCLYLTVTGSAIISPLLCPYSLSLSLSPCMCQLPLVAPLVPVQCITGVALFSKKSTFLVFNIAHYRLH